MPTQVSFPFHDAEDDWVKVHFALLPLSPAFALTNNHSKHVHVM